MLTLPAERALRAHGDWYVIYQKLMWHGAKEAEARDLTVIEDDT